MPAVEILYMQGWKSYCFFIFILQSFGQLKEIFLQ